MQFPFIHIHDKYINMTKRYWKSFSLSLQYVCSISLFNWQYFNSIYWMNSELILLSDSWKGLSCVQCVKNPRLLSWVVTTLHSNSLGNIYRKKLHNLKVFSPPDQNYFQERTKPSSIPAMPPDSEGLRIYYKCIVLQHCWVACNAVMCFHQQFSFIWRWPVLRNGTEPIPENQIKYKSHVL